jgi:uncharacterized membrane protein YGL010W
MLNSFFRRQLTDYVEYHRDPVNCAMHVFGILCLFLAAVLPLSTISVAGFGAPTNAASIAVLPVLIYWLLLDTRLGMAIVVAAVMLLSVALIIVSHASLVVMWLTTVALIVLGIMFQVVGHRVFERRQPALVDNPTHLLLGPIFVMAKLFIALGFRRDLAAIIYRDQKVSLGSSIMSGGRQGDPQAHP